MPKLDVDLTNFTAGELSPRLKGRVDVAKYFNGCESLLNFVIMPQGGATRRPGTRFVAAAKDQANPCRLLPFIFSTLQAYVVELSGTAARFYTNDGQLQLSGSPVAVSTPYGTSDLADIGYCQSADELFLTHPSYPSQVLARLSGTSWTLGPLTFLNGPYLDNDPGNALTPSGDSGSITLTWASTNGLNAAPGVAGGLVATDVGRSVQFTSPDETTVQWAIITSVTNGYTAVATVQAAVNNGAGGPGTLDTVGATTDWGLGKWSETTGYPFQPMFYQNRLYLCGTPNQPNAVEGSVIGDFFNFSAAMADTTVTPLNAVSWIISDDQVNAIRWLSPAGSAQMMQLGIGTVGSEKIFQPATNTESIGPTNLQAYQETAYGSAPNVRPQRIGKCVLFANRNGQKIHEWTWTWTVNGYLGPDLAVLAEHIVKPGVAQMAYQQLPHGIVWCLRSDGQLVGLTYLRDQDVVAWHRHVIGGQYYGGPPVVESIAVIPSPDATYDELWLAVLRTIDGVPFRSIEVMTKYFESAPAEDSFFVDCGISTVPTQPDGVATVTGLTNTAPAGRPPTLAGSGTLAITAGTAHVGDVLRMNGGRAVVTAIGVGSCSITVVYAFTSMAPAASGTWSLTTPFSTIGGLDYLAGEDVSILADGMAQPNATAAATLQLEGTASYVSAGLPYLSELITMPLAPMAKQGGGNTAGKKQRSERMYLRLHETIGGYFGQRVTDESAEAPTDEWDPIAMRTVETITGQPVEPLSAVFRFSPPGGSGIEVAYIARQDQPLPLTLLAIGGRISVEEVTP